MSIKFEDQTGRFYSSVTVTDTNTGATVVVDHDNTVKGDAKLLETLNQMKAVTESLQDYVKRSAKHKLP